MKLLDIVIGILVIPVAWSTMGAKSKTMDCLEQTRRWMMGEGE